MLSYMWDVKWEKGVPRGNLWGLPMGGGTHEGKTMREGELMGGNPWEENPWEGPM